MTRRAYGKDRAGRIGGSDPIDSECRAASISDEAATACAACPVRQSGVCSRMGREHPLIALGSRRQDIAAQSSVWTEECDAPCCVVLVRGILRSVHYGYDGRRHVISLIFPGEIVGRHMMRPGLSIEAATDARLCRLDPKVYAHLLRHSARFRDLVHHQAEADLERMRLQTLSLGVMTPEERLAWFLVQAAAVLPFAPLPSGGGVLTLSLPRADIADLLGTTIESISRITHKFEREGAIRILDPRHFEIPDLARLSRIASLDPTMQMAWASPDRPGEGPDVERRSKSGEPLHRAGEPEDRAPEARIIPFRRRSAGSDDQR